MTDYDRRLASKGGLLKVLEEAISENPEELLEGSLALYNKMTERYGNEPFRSVAELKEYDPKDYQMLVSRTIEALTSSFNDAQFQGNKLVVYRALRLKDQEQFTGCILKGSCKTGVYWSFKQSTARPYWGGSTGDTIILKGLIALESVNLMKTIKANTSSAHSANENEVTAFEGQPVFIIEAETPDGVLKIEKMNKT